MGSLGLALSCSVSSVGVPMGFVAVSVAGSREDLSGVIRLFFRSCGGTGVTFLFPIVERSLESLSTRIGPASRPVPAPPFSVRFHKPLN